MWSHEVLTPLRLWCRFVDELFNEIDVNKDGVLDFGEFLALVRRVSTRPALLGEDTHRDV